MTFAFTEKAVGIQQVVNCDWAVT